MKEHILREDSIPLYLQIKHNIADLIRSGQVQLGGQLPSEPKLADQFGVARLTVRQALGELAKDGLIERRRGVGTYVTDRADIVAANLAFPPSLTSLFTAQGYVPSSVTISKIVATSIPEWGRELLQLAPDESVVHIERLRLADNIPMAINKSWLPAKVVPGLTEIEFIGDSLIQTLVEAYQLLPSKGAEWVEPTVATAREAALLQVPEGTPLLLMTTISNLPDDTPIEFSKSWWRGDKLRLQINSRDYVMKLRNDLSQSNLSQSKGGS
jgi:GntR family transcriptional regulator